MCATTNREAKAGRPHEGGVDYGTETAAMRSRGDVRGDEYGREGSGGLGVDDANRTDAASPPSAGWGKAEQLR